MFSFALIYLSFPALVLSAAHPGVESIGRRTAQTTATCTGSFNWMENERGLSPCLVSAYVQGACTTNDFTTPAIQAGNNYNAPSGSTANACTCSWASYNLLQACTICQERLLAETCRNNRWAAYQEGCAKYISATTYFPAGVTLASNTTLPAWAGTDREIHFFFLAKQLR
ncbi:hypothetical protein PLICRDRAFT_114629 [Plicaturopsis crispa FD-325 SS-3]|nr:hypothetical protein PLICRDRAFT_114629 [Plicaturopsis crispa FD-325 SS-3]